MLRSVRTFQAVVRLGSFTEAAEECHISQSAISQQIKALEKELNVQLLTRHNRRFDLTPAGEHFYKKSLVLVADFDRLMQETKSIDCPSSEMLRIGYLKSYGSHAIRNSVAAFSQRRPEVAVQIISGNHEELYESLRNGSVDIVLNDQRRAFSEQYMNYSLAYKPCFVEIASRNPIASLDVVSPDELKNTPCILVASPAQQENERAYYAEYLNINSEFLFAQSLEQAQVMIVQNNGFMPVDGAEAHQPGASRLIPLERNGQPLVRRFCAFWRLDNTNPYLEEFAALLRDELS